VGAVKVWLDGGMMARTTAPYEGSGQAGAIRDLLVDAHVAGGQLAIHASATAPSTSPSTASKRPSRARPATRDRIGHAGPGVDDFTKDVPSNAGPKVAFRCNYPQSRTVAGFLRGRDGQDMSAALEQLAVGQAYVSTPEQATARKCSRRGTEPTT
jgi:hypothetical protein